MFLQCFLQCLRKITKTMHKLVSKKAIIVKNQPLPVAFTSGFREATTTADNAHPMMLLLSAIVLGFSGNMSTTKAL